MIFENIYSIRPFVRYSRYVTTFVPHTGKPICTYLLDLRISEAINLLQNTGISVAQIASMVGFCDLSHFSKMFKKKTEFSPTDFRIR